MEHTVVGKGYPDGVFSAPCFSIEIDFTDVIWTFTNHSWASINSLYLVVLVYARSIYIYYVRQARYSVFSMFWFKFTSVEAGRGKRKGEEDGGKKESKGRERREGEEKRKKENVKFGH